MKKLLLSLLVLMVLFPVVAGCKPITAPTPEATAITDTAKVNGIDLYYRIEGDGPPLLLLHGGLANSDYWSKEIPVLAKKFKVIAVDSRGHGRSTFTDEPISYELMASDVVALLDTLHIERADLVGWSDGGIIGLELAIHHPERLNKVVAYGANYNPFGVRADIGQNEKFNKFIEQAAADYQKIAPDPTRWDAFLANISNMWATEPNFTPEQLGAITTPILILDGKEEEAIDTNHTKKMADLIPGAELILMPGVGHFAPLEKPEEFSQIVLNFLAQ
jgi:pimeloyl-ACP methyl ester carboxylesterase